MRGGVRGGWTNCIGVVGFLVSRAEVAWCLQQEEGADHRSGGLAVHHGPLMGSGDWPAASAEFGNRPAPQLVNWTSPEEAPLFVTLPDQCRRKLLLHLSGNSYAARLKYLLACGSALVAPWDPWAGRVTPCLLPYDSIPVSLYAVLISLTNSAAEMAFESSTVTSSHPPPHSSAPPPPPPPLCRVLVASSPPGAALCGG